MQTSRTMGAALSGIALALAAIAFASSNDNDSSIAGADFDLSWHTTDCGGETFSTGNAFELGSTIGQLDAGVVMTGGSFQFSGGFWPGVGAGPIDTCVPDVSGDQIVNVDDLLAIINSWGPCAGCPADIAPPPSGNGQVNVDDMLAIINGWGSCP